MRTDARANKVSIAVTLGDPAGVGPEIVAKALTGDAAPQEARCVVVGPARHLRAALDALGLPAALNVTNDPKQIAWDAPGIALLEPPREGGWPDVKAGTVCAEGGEAAFQAVWLAAQMAVEGAVDAICTAPLHKQALQMAGHRFPGHTEILAAAAGVKRVVMLLQGGGLRVALVTIHAPVAEVPRLVTFDSVRETVHIVHAAMIRDWGIAAPRIAVTGLNPHAGDGGVLGGEEIAIISPAIAALRAEGVGASGPWPADTVFHQMLKGAFDVVVAMYHDQGLAAMKTIAFDEGVNITLGLPFIRTSVDHGTAMDIAGQNKANPLSLLCALREAADLARRRKANAKAM